MRIASVQSHVRFGDPSANAHRAIGELKRLHALGVEVVVFPEAFLTGYCVSSPEDARSIAIERDSSALNEIDTVCHELGMVTIIGFAEKVRESVYNTAALFDPGREPQFYQKTHLPDLGLDKFVCAGDRLPIFDTKFGKFGVLICFDLRFPEATRVLALKGAELIVLPTNWPEGAESSAEHISIARAAENRVFVATCNRVGEENGFRFIGRSKLIGVTGVVLAAAGSEEETIIADMDLSLARQKRTVTIPGKYETDLFGSRQPSLYESLAQ